jgi:ATP-dependent Clp protease protease subunit
MPTFSEPSGGASGQATDIAIHAKEIIRIRERLTAIYVIESAYDVIFATHGFQQQRHCGRQDESVEDGVKRFGMYVQEL